MLDTLMGNLKELNRNQRGFTVVELIVALVILLLALALAYDFFYYVEASYQRDSRATEAQQNARQAVERTVRELRQMQPAVTSMAVVEADWDRIRFYLNVDADEDLEQIGYVVENGEFKRRVYQPPYTNVESETTVAHDLVNENQDGRRLFEYFQTSGGDRLTNLSPDNSDGEGDQLSLIRLIKIKPIVDVRGGREFTIDAEVCPRNLGGT